MQTFLHFECVHTYSVFWDTVHINNGQNEALGHCLRDIMSMRHNTLPEYEACLPSFPYFKFYRGSCRSFHTFQLSCKVKCRKNYKKKTSRENLEKIDFKSSLQIPFQYTADVKSNYFFLVHSYILF